MVFEFSPESWILVLYVVLLFVGIFAKNAGVILLCGIGAVVIGLYAMGSMSFWVGFIMSAIGGGVGVVGFNGGIQK